jgi:hypothetical protein
MKTTFLIIALLVILTGLSLWLHAGPPAQTDQVRASSTPTAPYIQTSVAPIASATTTRTIGPVNATPSMITVNTSTMVTVTVQITDPALIAGSVNLVLLGALGTQPTILGVMHDDGLNGDAVAGDHIYTLQMPFNESSPSQIQFEVSAAFQGSLKRVVSPIAALVVLPGPPIGFTLDSAQLSPAGPVSFNNFGNNYLRGAVIPPNGAEIDGLSVIAPNGSLQSYISNVELTGSINVFMQTLTVSAVSCIQAFSQDQFTATLAYDNEAVYCPVGTMLYKFYLSYRDGDPNASGYQSTFQGYLSSVVFPH